MQTEWCVRFENKMTVDMSGQIKYSHMTFKTKEAAFAALELVLRRRHPDAIVMKRQITEWEAVYA